ncbi:hypothetical protein NLI96_g7759 [Meripilus lineatus]|uniref:mannan endo-1,6-alpha-mannosidase n=1 Tax=Meripilus lineatus TaxID=2056292 RepID=A0AAD5UYK4_9APHY|nr:hypothetical protein NLI96_g7759 [Physisporinus lineatus]
MPPTFSQDFSIPISWRKPTLYISLEARKTVTESVIESLVSLFNSTTGLIDSIKDSMNQEYVLNLPNQLSPIECMNLQHDNKYNSDPMNWGLAAAYAYRAYRDDYLLATAVSVWNNMYEYFVTTAQAVNGTHPLKSATFNPACNGANAGAVFYVSDNPDDTQVNGGTVCAFMALSAHLLELTSNSTYHHASELSANFIKANLFNGAIVNDTISLGDCTITTTVLTYDSGFFIEGLAIYANITQNADWTLFLNYLITTTINFSGWTSEEGIMIEDVDGPDSPAETNGFTRALKGIYVRGLYETWARSQRGSDVANLIEAYINVQYNALLELASNDSYNFSSSWPGPPPTHLLPWGQVAALDVLNAGIGIAQAYESLSPSRSSETPAVSSSKSPNVTNKNPNVSRTVGLTIAAVIVILGAIFAVFFIRRQSRKNCQVADPSEPVSSASHDSGHDTPIAGHRDGTTMVQVDLHTYSVEPFTLSSPTVQHRPENLKNSGISPIRSTQVGLINPSRSDSQGGATAGLSSRTRSARDSANGSNGDPSRLLAKLNRALAKFPQRRVVADDEDSPPEYRER